MQLVVMMIMDTDQAGSCHSRSFSGVRMAQMRLMTPALNSNASTATMLSPVRGPPGTPS